MLLMLKLFFSKALDIAMRYPLQIILVIVSLYAINQKSQHNAIKRDFEIYKETVEQAGKFRELQNHLMKKQSDAALNDVIATHKESLTLEKLDRKSVENKLKGSINEISNELNIYRSAVRLRNSSTIGARVPTLDENSIRSAEAHGNCNETLAVVVDACKITDYDYEALYNLYNKQCQIYGCE
jgi:uncharacterized transporter YbjL